MCVCKRRERGKELDGKRLTDKKKLGSLCSTHRLLTMANGTRGERERERDRISFPQANDSRDSHRHETGSTQKRSHLSFCSLESVQREKRGEGMSVVVHTYPSTTGSTIDIDSLTFRCFVHV